MSDTHIWTIDVSGDVIGTLLPDSVFYTGPFTPGSQEYIADIHIENTGNMGGIVTIKLVEYPDQPEEADLMVKPIPLAPGGDHLEQPFISIPVIPGGQWPLGVKVWGETEAEPAWGGLGTWKLGRMEIPPWVIPAVALGGLLGISYFALKK